MLSLFLFQILAVILSNMGIALFAYMDGYAYKSTTIVGVILAAASAATFAVFKVRYIFNINIVFPLFLAISIVQNNKYQMYEKSE